ncbi:MAG: hypothetical protein GWP59_06180 [Chlamydiales bacterium]|nr:DNA polymerase III subunit chi [Chlamydiales bacterium]NCF71270.1 hypothetical protein [Chlamydiales bacterium]
MIACTLSLKNSKERLQLLKQCANFFWEQRKCLGVVCEDEKAKNFIEDYFWKFPKNSFIPSTFIDSNAEAQKLYEPLVISYENQSFFEASFFFNFSSHTIFDKNSYLIYMLSSEEEKKQTEDFLNEKGVTNCYSFESAQALLDHLGNHVY